MTYTILSANAINGEFVSKELLFKESDIVFLCVPLTNLTRMMVNMDVMKSMKSNCILINTARGGKVTTLCFVIIRKGNKRC